MLKFFEGNLEERGFWTLSLNKSQKAQAKSAFLLASEVWKEKKTNKKNQLAT